MEQVILVTGATDGIGKKTATALAEKNRNATILIHGRNADKLSRAAGDIQTLTGNPNIETYLADFSALPEVRQMAEAILARHDRLEILINNAGAGFAAPRYGKDGIETRLAVNYLAPFLLTHLLLPALREGSPSRIVNVSSAGQSAIHFDDVNMKENFDGQTAYTQSKLALLMFTIDLAETLKEEQITVNALHPGTYLDTGMVREAGIQPRGTADAGAEAVLYLATAPELEHVTGKYFNMHREARGHSQAYDADARRRLRHMAMTLTGLEEPAFA